MQKRDWWMGLACAALTLAATGCRTMSGASRGGETTQREEVQFDPVVVHGDLELEKLNDEELFAKGTAANGAGDYKQAARFFGRIADFHPNSPHRRFALYSAGLAHQRLQEWEEAGLRFTELAEPQKGSGDALDSVFRLAETHYHLGRYRDAAELLAVVGAREDLPAVKRMEAQVQQGVCLVELGELDRAEKLLRKVVHDYNNLTDRDEVDSYHPSQAQFFVGEIYRIHYEAVQLDVSKGVDALSQDLEYKAQLLLSAQGNYLRAIRMGNGYWATAAGAQVGSLYESLYSHMVNTPAPPELTAEQADLYRQELRKKIRVLLSKAINIYERTLEAAERIGTANTFVERTRESLQKMKELLVADVKAEEEDAAAEGATPAAAPGKIGTTSDTKEPQS